MRIQRLEALAFGLILLLLTGACGEPADPLDEIRALRQERRFGQMLDPLRRLIDADPSRAEAHLLLGEALLTTGQAGLAVWPLQRASESPEYAVEAGLLLTQAMLESRTAPDAIVAIERVLELEPENEAAMALRIDAYLATGKLEEALADIERALESDPENLQILVPRVTTLIGLERIDEAEVALDEAQVRMEAAGDSAPRVTKARLCLARGLFAIAKEEIEVGEARYAECLEAYPTDRLVVTESVSFHDLNGRPDRATEILEQAFSASGDGFFRVALARRMGVRGSPEEEERLLLAEAEERPSQRNWFAVADYYVQRDRFDEALVAFEKVLARSSDPAPMLRFAYADTLVQAGRYDEAYAVAEELDQVQLRSMIRGRILLEQGDAQGALVEFEAGLRLWPNNPAARYLAGQAAERIGLFERAISEYRESLRAGAAITEAGLALAPLHAQQKDHEGALAAIQGYVQSHQGDPEGYAVAIRICQAANRPGLAREGLDRMAKLPGQAGRALAIEVDLVSEVRGAEAAAEIVEKSELDLTDPTHHEALAALLVQLGAMGQNAQAEARVESALKAHPEAAAFHALRGEARRAAGDPRTEVEADYQRALELDAKHVPALLGLAELAAEAGEPSAAIDLYDRALEIEDAAAPDLEAAKILLEGGDVAAGVERLRRLLERHPRESSAALLLAEQLLLKGDLDGARDYASRAAWFEESGSGDLRAKIEAKSSPGAAEAATDAR